MYRTVPKFEHVGSDEEVFMNSFLVGTAHSAAEQHDVWGFSVTIVCLLSVCVDFTS
jgi:hypothetical protein